MVDPFRPDAALLAKLASIVVHVEEGLGDGAHEFDWAAARTLIGDPEVQRWLGELRKLALVPVKRR